ncbi:hypothetical protein E6C27_scaffold578G00210 [Cucumis melo var. makuwa]|uniref:Uncharacterized protein n=1 Tax=Cucumis melo var. makuwa TaxID=1194695 RepID=A0A5A7UEB5_CUCMM|nr:hypothetical protein E6C27_scaffold578G00210 [Cucumis melo var. makuwa]
MVLIIGLVGEISYLEISYLSSTGKTGTGSAWARVGQVPGQGHASLVRVRNANRLRQTVRLGSRRGDAGRASGQRCDGSSDRARRTASGLGRLAVQVGRSVRLTSRDVRRGVWLKAALGDGLQMGFRLARREGFRSAKATACGRGVRLAGLRGFTAPDSTRRRETDEEPTRDCGWAPV